MEWGIVLNVLHGANGSSVMDHVASLSGAKPFQGTAGLHYSSPLSVLGRATLKNLPVQRQLL